MNMNLDAIRNGVSLPNFFAKLPKVPVASAVSGLIVAALILMTPNPWFEAFIVETGLPGVLTAAEPPLGARARIVFALIAALIVTIGAWVALSAILRRKSQARSEESVDYAPDKEGHESPRIRRRADSHPDAPYRRPIMAGDEMGVPLDLVTTAPEGAGDDEIDALDLGDVAEVVEQPMPFVDPIESEATPVEEEYTPVSPEGGAIDAVTATAEPVFEISLPQRDAVLEDALSASAECEKGEIASPPAPVPPAEIKSELADLVARLEAGIERKQAKNHGAQDGFADQAHENVTAHPQAQPRTRSGTDQDAALREALNALQRVAGKAS